MPPSKMHSQAVGGKGDFVGGSILGHVGLTEGHDCGYHCLPG